MKKETIKTIKSLCGEEVKFISLERNAVTVLLPYSTAEFEIQIEGDTIQEQVESFTTGVNYLLDEMIDHLDDCKLRFNEM